LLQGLDVNLLVCPLVAGRNYEHHMVLEEWFDVEILALIRSFD